MNRMTGKVAIVTASTKGIGKAIATSFVAEGAEVYLACRNPELGEQVAAELCAMGPGKAVPVLFDAYKFESYEPMVDEVLAKAGRIDVLVNNFGGTSPMRDLDILNGVWDKFVKDQNVNLASVYIPSQLVIRKAMLAQKSGSIINIGSIAGVNPDYKQCAYGVAKAGIIHLSKMIAVQCGQYGIRCNVVCPGMTATDAVTNNLTEDYVHKFAKQTPLKRMALPEEIAAIVTYFAGDEAAFTTGQVLNVEGGYSVAPSTYGDDIGAKALES